ncbi:hypothetical protein DPMN_191205 [Dreissena polymorpha]|uniref:Uncharacterized protein n=1 Tax=Dreissena polymorpha TaxID=45954 RepID=A0A9D4BD82_DREPO|nr:hypothetical protein DPMN_191205 [Dreissena polymorpha]
MEDILRLKLQYVATVTNQEVVQQQLNIQRFLRGRLRLKRGARACNIWKRPLLHAGRRRQFGIYDQLMVELRRVSPGTFKKFLRMPSEMNYAILRRVRHRLVKQHTRYREPLDPGLK